MCHVTGREWEEKGTLTVMLLPIATSKRHSEFEFILWTTGSAFCSAIGVEEVGFTWLVLVP